MNLRHAAAVTLIGWYLLMPPLEDYGASSASPLSEWYQSSAFDTAAACEASLGDLWDCRVELKKGAPKQACDKIDNSRSLFMVFDKKDKNEIPRLIFQLSNMKCIATDDPRLSEYHFHWHW